MLSREDIMDEIRGMYNAHKRLRQQNNEQKNNILAGHHRIAEVTLQALIDELYEKDESLNDK
jgi:hypothetical protein